MKRFFIYIKDWAEVLVFFAITVVIILLLISKFLGFESFAFGDQLDFYATLQANTINIYSRQKGIVSKRLVNRGDLIRKGDLMTVLQTGDALIPPVKKANWDSRRNIINSIYNVEIRDIDIEEDIFLSRLALEESRQNLQHAQSALKQSERNYEFTSELFKKDAATFDEMDSSLSEFLKSNNKVEKVGFESVRLERKVNYLLQKRIKNKERSREIYDLLEEHLESFAAGKTPFSVAEDVISPVDGILLASFISDDMYLPPNQKLFTIAYLDRYKIILPVSAKEKRMIYRTGIKGTFTLSDFPDDTFEARVIHVNGSEVEIEVLNSENKLRPAMQGILTLYR